MYDPGAERLRQLDRTVGGAVVGNQHLTAYTCVFDRGFRLLNARGERLGLVEARHHDRDVTAGFLLAAGTLGRGDAVFGVGTHL